MEALNTVRISERDQEHAFQMITSVLWLGNIMFQVVDNESHVEVVQSEAVTNAASLIGLILALSTCQIQAGKDKVAKSLIVEQATDRRDALAKFIYANSFDWIVDQMNRNLAMGKEQIGRSINVLNIYGFESFKEYELDGIDWSKVDFEDNQESLELFEKVFLPFGSFSYLFGIRSLYNLITFFHCGLQVHFWS